MSASQKNFNKALNGYILSQKYLLIDNIEEYLKEKLPNEDVDDIIQKFKDTHITVNKEEKIKSEKKPRKKTAYNNFMKFKLALLKEENNSDDTINYRENFSIASKSWKELSDNEKKKYQP